MANKLLCILLFFLSLSFLSITTVVFRSLSNSMPFDVLSGGVRAHRNPQHIVLNLLPVVVDAEIPCKQTYGFLPCSATALGNLFLIIVYGYLIFKAVKYVSCGSEQLELLGTGILGDIVFPKLSAFPGAFLILVSGLSETKETAQSQVSVGMGLLAGSTVMLITVIWGSCVIVGKCDIEGSIAKDGQNTKGFSLTETGVSTDYWTCYAARILAISVIPFVVAQIPQILGSTSGRHLAVLIALIVSVLMLIAYCVYEVFQPRIKRWRLAYAKHKHVLSGFLKHLRNLSLGSFLNDRGEPNKDVIKKIDENKDGRLSLGELKALIIGIELDEINLDNDDIALKLLNCFCYSCDVQINSEEFFEGISKWLNEVNQGKRSGDRDPQMVLNDFHEETKREHYLLGDNDQSDKVVVSVENPKLASVKAYSMLVIGTIISSAFANPLKDTVINFSIATTIPSFFISFIALPLATTLSDVIPILIYASRKRMKKASLAFIELYRTVLVNNFILLSVFLAVVYIRGLRWEFSSEMLAILIVCFVMGGFAGFRTTFPLWTSLVAYILYPFSLVLIYVLEYVFGWL